MSAAPLKLEPTTFAGEASGTWGMTRDFAAALEGEAGGDAAAAGRSGSAIKNVDSDGDSDLPPPPPAATQAAKDGLSRAGTLPPQGSFSRLAAAGSGGNTPQQQPLGQRSRAGTATQRVPNPQPGSSSAPSVAAPKKSPTVHAARPKAVPPSTPGRGAATAAAGTGGLTPGDVTPAATALALRTLESIGSANDATPFPAAETSASPAANNDSQKQAPPQPPTSVQTAALIDDAREVIVLLTREITRLRKAKLEMELRVRDDEALACRTRAAELDEAYIQRYGPRATPLPSLDDGGSLDREVLVRRVGEAEKALADAERRLRKRRGEAERLRAELKEQIEHRQEDLEAIQRMAKQNAALAQRLDAANAEVAAAKAREQQVMRRANEVTRQVKDATRGTIEALETALQEALEHNRVLKAERDVARARAAQQQQRAESPAQ